jgi:hypothetical protein
MKNVLLYIVLILGLNSCATILNSPFQRVNIDHENGIRVRVDTTKYYYKESAVYNVYYPKNYGRQSLYFLRCSATIPLIINDTDTIKLKPHRSYLMFWFANIYTSYGIGMLVDYQNDKSFEYPIHNYIARENDNFRNIRFKPYRKNQVHFSLGLPVVNCFHLETDSGKSNTVSGLGISGQIEYFLSSKTYLALGAGATMDLFGAYADTAYNNGYSYYGPFFETYSSSEYISLDYNKITPKLDYGIGLSLTELRWNANNRVNLSDTSFTYSHSSYRSLNLGIKLSASYRLTANASFGVEYHPLIFDIERKKSTYQHFIAFKAAFRL